MSNSGFNHRLITAVATLYVIFFGMWWFNPIHIPHNFSGISRIFDDILFLGVSYIIWHPIIMDVLSWLISLHIKELPKADIIPGMKVAFVTTIVPANESLDLLHKCLPAMVNADYPHDTWLLDEGNNEKVKQICEYYGVKHFSRFENSKYNMSQGKFAKKTKGGNHNSWYDVYGNTYDIVAQIDTDFVPKNNFLTKTLGYFKDPKVAFVGTPQIYGNINSSLIAKGAAQQQYNFYGTILRGLSGMSTSILIGANHVIRVKALQEVNHYSAHITEDLLTGMKLHAKGWKSIYLSLPLAIGEGPQTWEAYFNQQMRWAYGCMDILFNYSYKLFKQMGIKRTLYYFFLQQHYFSGIASAISVILLIIYFFAGITAANISLFSFVLLYSFVLLLGWLMSVWLQRFNVDPDRENGLHLAGKLISIAVWPIYFLAFMSVLTRKRLTYKVTPKGTKSKITSATTSLFVPHIIFGVLALIALTSSFYTHRQNILMLFWAFNTALLMLSIPFSQQISQAFLRLQTNASDLAKNIPFLYVSESVNTSKEKKVINRSANYTQVTFINHKLTKKLRSVSWVFAIIFDCIFLSLAVIVSTISYIKSLGFYSDDWSFLGDFSIPMNQTLSNLTKVATTPNTAMRPVQNFYDALLYWLFHLNPFDYHIINAAVIVMIALLFYFTLRVLRIPRIIAVAAPLIYMLLPNYATDRFWYAAFQANLSMMFYFLSLFTGLLSLSAFVTKRTWYQIVSIGSLLLSTFSYEVTVPLFLLNMVLFWHYGSKNDRQIKFNKKIFIIVTIIALAYVTIFKYMTTIRLGGLTLPEYPSYLNYLVHMMFQTNYGFWLLNLPSILRTSIQNYATSDILNLSYIFGGGIFLYLVGISIKAKEKFPKVSWMIGTIWLSLLIVILGYAIFITNKNVGFSPTGIENRVAIAASLGVALSIVGVLGLLSKLAYWDKLSKILFSALIAVVSVIGFIIINSMATFWTTAYQKQLTILTDIYTNNPTISSHSTILLDGVCPYVGPASVFESQWDLKGALQTHYHDKTLQADIVTPTIKVTDKGITTTIYNFKTTYSYSKLYIYNATYKRYYLIPNAQVAALYFNVVNPSYNSCPQGQAGNGVSIY